jgi:hypothetical protein
MNSKLIDEVTNLAGFLRATTIRAAATFILENNLRNIVETGCYRGNPADGNSTLIFAMLVKELSGQFNSYDVCPSNCDKAMEMLSANDLPGFVTLRDSVLALGELNSARVDFVYLDSYDHDPGNPGPCQRHELAEIGAVYHALRTPCGILLDDCIPETGGKTLLGAKFLEDRGWKLIAQGYQLLYVRT